MFRGVRALVSLHIALVIVTGLALWAVFSPLVARGFAVGAGLSAVNLIGLTYAWPRLLEKKSIALPMAVVVSKFALSLGVIYWVTRSTNTWFESGGAMIGFLIGLGTIIPATLVGTAVAIKNDTGSDSGNDSSDGPQGGPQNGPQKG